MLSINDDSGFLIPEAAALVLTLSSRKRSNNFAILSLKSPAKKWIGGGKADRQNLQTAIKTVNSHQFCKFRTDLQIQADEVLFMAIFIFCCYVRK